MRLRSLHVYCHGLREREPSSFCPTKKGHLRTDKEVKTSLQWLHSVPCPVRMVANHWRWLKMLFTFLESKWQRHRNPGQTVVCTFPAGLRDPDTVHDVHTQCHIWLLLCPSVIVAKCPGTSYLKPQVPRNYVFSTSSEHNRANILLFPARVLVLYQSQALRCLGVVSRQCPPDTVITQNISLKKWQIANVLISLFCSWLPLILVTWNLAESTRFCGLWTFGGMDWQRYRQSWSFSCWKWEF